MSGGERVSVQILDKEYQVSCLPDEREALLEAARELNERMRKVKNSGPIVGTERIAVMVALNLCHELQKNRKKNSESSIDHKVLINLSKKLDMALKSHD